MVCYVNAFSTRAIFHVNGKAPFNDSGLSNTLDNSGNFGMFSCHISVVRFYLLTRIVKFFEHLLLCSSRFVCTALACSEFRGVPFLLVTF